MAGRLIALPAVLGLLTSLLLGLLVLDSGCTLGSFQGNNNNTSNNNNNANNSNASNNNNSGSNANNTNTSTGLSLGPVSDISSSHNSSRSAAAIPQNLRVDDLGNAYAAWEETDASGFDLQVKFAQQPSGGSWTTPVTLSTGTSGSPVGAGTLRMDVHRTNGQVHVVWIQGTGSFARTMATHNRSGSFVTAFAVSSSSGEPAATPAVRVDGAGNAHYVWTRLLATRRIVYRGLFSGNLDGSESEVSARGTHTADDAFTDPDGLVLLPGSGDQAVGIAFPALIAGQQAVLYTERSAGSSGSFGEVIDVSLEESGTHPTGTAAITPRTALNASGDLVVFWAAVASNGVRNTRVNGRPRSGSFRSTSVNLTGASVGDSSRATAPVDFQGRGVLDGGGGLHLAWEDIPGSGENAFRHRYLPTPASDPSEGAITAFANTTAFTANHALQSALDGSDSLFVAWEQEDATALRDLFIRRRGAGTSSNFDSTTRLTTTADDTHLRGLGVTSGGRAFVLGDEGVTPFVLAAVRETNGNVSGPVDVSRQSNLPSQGIVLRMTATGVAHAFWLTTFSGLQRDLMHATVE